MHMKVDPQFIKSARIKLGMTQAELAAALGIERRSVMRYEQGRRRITQTTALAIKQVLAQHKQSR